MDDRDFHTKVDFTMDLGKALHRYGVAADSFERGLSALSASLGLYGEVFSTPTFLMASFRALDGDGGATGHTVSRIARVQPGDTDLEKLCELDALGDRVVAGGLSVVGAQAELNAILTRPDRYGAVPMAASFGIASAAVAVFLGGRVGDVAASTLIGLLVGVFAVVQGRVERLVGVQEALAALIVSVCAIALQHVVPGLSIPIVSLASLIVLIPGLAVTVAVAELATQHLVAGTSRLMGAAATLLKLAFGMAMGTKLMGLWWAMKPGVSAGIAGMALPEGSKWVALAASALAFTVLFRAQPRDAGWVLLSATSGYLATTLGSEQFGVEFGGFLGGLVVGGGSNAFARFAKRPASLMLLPGIILLVPGSLGYKSLRYLFEHNVLTGVESAFSMVVIAVALVAGLLFGNLAIPAQRSL